MKILSIKEKQERELKKLRIAEFQNKLRKIYEFPLVNTCCIQQEKPLLYPTVAEFFYHLCRRTNHRASLQGTPATAQPDGRRQSFRQRHADPGSSEHQHPFTGG